MANLNPFVNLFDNKLHTLAYIRPRSSFLFTVLMMAGAKFFKPELFKRLQKMAYVFASRYVKLMMSEVMMGGLTGAPLAGRWWNNGKGSRSYRLSAVWCTGKSRRIM